MDITLHPAAAAGRLSAIPSKSHVHRLLICAALSDKKTDIICSSSSADIDATVGALNSLGAHITSENGVISVDPIKKLPDHPTLDCGESGSTLRFLLPVIAALGCGADLLCRGRLASRPLSPLKEALEAHGAVIRQQGNVISLSGKLSGGEFSFAGNVSSQFATGLLLAFPLCSEESSLTLTGKIESLPYINITLSVLSSFGIETSVNAQTYSEHGKYTSPGTIKAEGDWSNAAFMLAAGAFSDEGVTVYGLDADSAQGDSKIVGILHSFGASCTLSGDSVCVKKGALNAFLIDAAQIPDLVPIISVIAALASGRTVIKNCGRLRLKESDRIESVCAMIRSLGGNIENVGEDLIIDGKSRLSGGTVDSFGDHRIVMAASVASLMCDSPVTILNAQAANKSYPAFFEDFRSVTKRKESL